MTRRRASVPLRAARGPRVAALKLAGLLCLGAAVLAVRDVAWLLALLAAACGGATLAGARPAAVWRQVRAVLPLVAVVLLAHGVAGGWEGGAVVVLRVLVLVTAACAVTLSTPTEDVLAAVTAACRPLRALGADPARVALLLAMTLRFVPLIAERVAAVREAQRARGVERPGPSVLVPVLVGTLRLADEIADALDARGAADGAGVTGPAGRPGRAADPRAAAPRRPPAGP